MKDNLRRIRSQNSLFENNRATNTYNWRDQYFPKPDESPIIHQRYQERSEHDPQQYDKLIKMYQLENQEIKQKNNILVENVRQLKEKQDHLLEEVAELEAHYRKLLKIQRNFHGEENNKQNRLNNKNFACQSQVTNYTPNNDLNKQITQNTNEIEDLSINYLKQTKEKEDVLQYLNDSFCAMVEQSISEKDPQKRKQLRKQMAQLATQMKKIRNNEIGYKYQNEYGITKDRKTEGAMTTKRIEELQDTLSYQSLAPYLESTNDKAHILYSNSQNKKMTNINNTNASKKF